VKKIHIKMDEINAGELLVSLIDLTEAQATLIESGVLSKSDINKLSNTNKIIGSVILSLSDQLGVDVQFADVDDDGELSTYGRMH
jgi:hypothetical protein